MERKLDLKLRAISKNFIKEGGFIAQANSKEVYSYEELLNEVISKHHFNISASFLDMILKATFNTMVDGILSDGISRRIGDFIQLQLKVRGKFDSEGEDFDEEKHKLAISVRPLKALRVSPGMNGVSVINRNAGPKVVIERTHSPGLEGNQLKWGAPIIIEGENLHLLDDGKDELTFKYFSQMGVKAMLGVFGCSEWVSEDGTRMTIPWSEIAEDLEPQKEVASPLGMMIGIRSRGGKATAKIQLHRAKAYFDTWLKKHPDYADDFGRTAWGKI